MQLPPTSSAAQAAGVFAQTTAKDKSNAATANTSHSNAAHVEKSGSSSSDRDAQGQGDGLGERHPRRADSESAEPTQDHAPLTQAPQLPGEPPSQLDIVG